MMDVYNHLLLQVSSKVTIFFYFATMNIILFSRKQLKHRPEQIEAMFRAIDNLGMNYVVNEDFASVIEQLLGRKIEPQRIFTDKIVATGDDVMVTYGGDGTLLDGVALLPSYKIPVVGINCGHLGYLTADDGQGVEELFRRIADGEILFEPRQMLRVEGDFDGGDTALNEVAIHRSGATMITIEVYINDRLVATCHGDGMVISTPTGSTAYSLSAGGPVVDPMCRCVVLSPLAPHNLTMRPVVAPDSARITLRLATRYGEALLSADNRTYKLKDGASIRLTQASEPLILATPHNNTFYDTLRKKMMWGVDKREE